MASAQDDRRSILKKAGVGAALAWASPTIVSLSPAAAQSGPPPPGSCALCDAGNLVVNPSFEVNDFVNNAGDRTFNGHGWTTTAGTPLANQYTSPSFGLTRPVGGDNYFAYGGQSGTPVSATSQSIDLSVCAAAIDAQTVSFNLSAYIGGWGAEQDTSTVEVEFRDASNTQVGPLFTIGPVTPQERGYVAMMLLRELNGGLPTPVPPGARSALVTCRFVYVPNDLFVDGYVDVVVVDLVCG